jgi:hypothetical protein
MNDDPRAGMLFALLVCSLPLVAALCYGLFYGLRWILRRLRG